MDIAIGRSGNVRHGNPGGARMRPALSCTEEMHRPAGYPDDDVERSGPVIREELRRLFTWEERHRRLAARLLIASGLTLLVLAAGSVLIWAFESGQKGGNIHGFGDAVFFTAVQLLTVSSSMTNPVTTAGKVVDVALEAWAIFVVTAVAGSFASFFTSGDSS
jgi:hypothetical protein